MIFFSREVTIAIFDEIYSFLSDESARKVLAETQKQFRLILDRLPVGLLIHQEQNILFANQAACELLGSSPNIIQGSHILDHLSADENDKVARMLTEAFSHDGAVEMEHIHLPEPGAKRRTIALTVAKIPWKGREVAQILLQDVTQQVERLRQIQNMMATDGLTGAQNRKSFIDYASELGCSETSGNCGFMLWDIDFFRNVNDSFGHQAGDTAMKAVVLEVEKILAHRILVERPDLPRPMLSRFGGEEFAVLIPDTDLDETLAYAEKIRHNIEKLEINFREHRISLTISIGVVMGDLVFDDIDHMLGLADKALYAAKENGRNQVVCAQAGMPFPPEGRRVSRGQNRTTSTPSRRVH